jgi:hypothetical protein
MAGSRVRVGGALGVVVVLVVASCAASDTPPADNAATGYEAPGRGSPYTPGQPGLAARRAAAQAEIGEALRALEVAGDACGSACPPLADLRVGVGHLCGVADTKDDDRMCKESRATLLATESKLRPSCGACKPPPADADTTDDDAGEPVP